MPIPNKEYDAETMTRKGEEVERMVRDAGIRVRLDASSTRTPGWKYSHWELKGVPLRVELGARDVANNKATLVRRDGAHLQDGKGKVEVPLSTLLQHISLMLVEMQHDLFARASATVHARLKQVVDWEG